MNAEESQILPKTSQMVSFEENGLLPEDHNGRAWVYRGHRQFLAHRHAELEANLCLSGNAIYLLDGRKVGLARRTFLWLHAGQDHVLLEQSSDFSMAIAIWKPEFLAPLCTEKDTQILLEASPSASRTRRLESEDFEWLEALWTRPFPFDNGPHLDAAMAFLLLEAHACFGRANAATPGKAVHRSVARAAQILARSSPSLPELAREVGLSPARLSRLFKAEIGATISDFRTQKQLERFQKLSDDLSLSAAAREAGFGSYAQFHRVWTQKMGCPPSHSRRK